MIEEKAYRLGAVTF